MSPQADATPASYVAAISELDEIVAALDADDIDVDVLATRVARASVLIALCRERIDVSQREVQAIIGGLGAGGRGDAIDDGEDEPDDTDEPEED
jgi:exodeoxyribonuclease VII small subunit